MTLRSALWGNKGKLCMYFHMNQRKAENLLSAIMTQEAYAPLRERAQALQQLFVQPDMGSDYAGLHSGLCFLIAPNLSAAIGMAAGQRSCSALAAEGTILRAVEKAPNILGSPAELYAKDVALCGKRAMPVPDKIKENSDFARAREKIEKRYAGIIEIALETALRHKAKVKGADISVHTLRYMAAQLMPKGNERDFRINALSLELKTAFRHEEYLEKSRQQIMKMAEELHIDMPSDHLVKGAVREKEASQPKKIPKSQFGGEKKPGIGHNSRYYVTEAPKDPIPSNDDYNRLRHRLMLLISTDRISRLDAAVYSYLNHPEETRKASDAAQRFGIHKNAVQDRCERVEKCLAGFDRKAAPERPALKG